MLASEEDILPRRVIVPHARTRMEMRGIPEMAIDRVLEHYHTSRPAGPRPGAKPCVIYIGEWEGRDLRVYVERGSAPPRIMTAAWEERP